MAAARALVEGTRLRFDEVADRTGVGPATIGRWARRHGWRSGSLGSEPLDARTVETRAAVRKPSRYGPAEHEAARALIEGSRLGLERIGLKLGIGTATLFRWQKRFGWRRPGPPDRPGPYFYRFRRLRGRPYAADAIGVAERLVTGTLLSQKRIAAQVGVSQATVSNWIRRRGWLRPEVRPSSRRFAASRRTAPVASSGDRRGRRYDPDVVATARDLYGQTELSTRIIAARVRVSAVTVARWAKVHGWTRPRDLPDAFGRVKRRRRRGAFA